MNTNGMSQVGTYTPDNLIAGNRHPVDVCHVVIKTGQQLERGTILEKDGTEPGKYVIRGTMAAARNAEESVPGGEKDSEQQTVEGDKDVKAEYILAENVDASDEDVVAAAYYAGEFAENALIVKEGYQINDEDRSALRNAGIFLKTIMM